MLMCGRPNINIISELNTMIRSRYIAKVEGHIVSTII